MLLFFHTQHTLNCAITQSMHFYRKKEKQGDLTFYRTGYGQQIHNKIVT